MWNASEPVRIVHYESICGKPWTYESALLKAGGGQLTDAASTSMHGLNAFWLNVARYVPDASPLLERSVRECRD